MTTAEWRTTTTTATSTATSTTAAAAATTMILYYNILYYILIFLYYIYIIFYYIIYHIILYYIILYSSFLILYYIIFYYIIYRIQGQHESKEFAAVYTEKPRAVMIMALIVVQKTNASASAAGVHAPLTQRSEPPSGVATLRDFERWLSETGLSIRCVSTRVVAML
jgi:hypothetical protein